MRFAVDTGGTFTDLVVEDDEGGLQLFKASTTPADPIRGVTDALELASGHFGCPLRELLGRASMFIYGTTHALNAVVTGRTARTAFLTTQGHPDILTLREGGRADAFDFSVPTPAPYVPRSLTWEVPGRMRADGREHTPLDEAALRRIVQELRARDVEAVAVCLLWSIANPAHELRLGELLREQLPGVPFTLSHQLNPTLREYRRASSTCIDASLKPMMAAYLATLAQRLEEAGFRGRTLVVTSQGGVMDARDAAAAPIALVNSGPSMAPVAGRYFARADEGTDTAIVADTGGTTYDVSLVRRGAVPWTRESWIGPPWRGHMTGFASVDVTSVGAGGGSIAWVDDAGMLHVGPQSAGSQPGPACYGRGGTQPTVTDASLVLGHLDPAFFLGGAMPLDAGASRRALQEHVAGPLGIGLEQAASAVIELATEGMVQAILDICVNQGVDPSAAILVGGGGAAGLNSCLIARRLQSPRLLIPQVGAALSAAGAMLSTLSARYQRLRFTRRSAFDFAAVEATLSALEQQCDAFVAAQGDSVESHRTEFWVEARYAEQVWEISVPLPDRRIANEADLFALCEAFHRQHEELFAVRDAQADIEWVGWGAGVSCRVRGATEGLRLRPDAAGAAPPRSRRAWFAETGWVEAAVHRFDQLPDGASVHGPALVESSFTTVVLHPGASAQRRESGSLAISPGASA
ncbi:hydantoinase/oxoprolinase family protein [Ramlibacter sp. AW1]|uniref:Hydantoinase/oxoprolinase family protein n=1 Tax=Ramlibacter aurantiacus TaxID=2801330 RepID=A0A937D934_9BURK|nr:hydantoinase/oxoprolinase family protein [Ramlibacter aurantiacus]MBL0422721.1 hydantoinase/oxoprolinase family protein [Ramlibacter aurantiacus]